MAGAFSESAATQAQIAVVFFALAGLGDLVRRIVGGSGGDPTDENEEIARLTDGLRQTQDTIEATGNFVTNMITGDQPSLKLKAQQRHRQRMKRR